MSSFKRGKTPVSNINSTEPLSTDDWKWEPFYIKDFWIGIDGYGQKWLTKLRGSFRGYREKVFSCIAINLGWSHQISRFASFNDKTLAKLNRENDERYHSVSIFLDKHGDPRNCKSCPLILLNQLLNSKTNQLIPSLRNIPIKNILDWPKCEVASGLFGATESSERFITDDHKLLMVDSELMFSDPPEDVKDSKWWLEGKEGRRLVLEVYSSVASLTDQQLNNCLHIHEGIIVQHLWDIREIVYSARDHAKTFIDQNQDSL